jgi:hypothetical protein
MALPTKQRAKSVYKEPTFQGENSNKRNHDGHGWVKQAYLAKKVPHAATTPIATAFKICISHRKNRLLNRLPTKVSFPFFD